jgi:hypothetical protein
VVRLLAVPLEITSRRPRRGGGDEMSAVKIVAIVLIAAGILGLAYGKFSYTKETHEAKLGPLELSVKDKEMVNVPVWVGVGAIVVGGLLLLVPNKI